MLGFSKIKIGVINLKSHNLFSILQAMKNIGYKTKIVENYKEIIKTDMIILPGVGSFKYAMNYLNKTGLKDELLKHTIIKRKSLFGICLGMQLLFTKSEEFGKTKGLNLFQGKVKKINTNNKKVPHIGWNNIKKKNRFFLPKKVLTKKFYFTHSFYCEPKNINDIHTETKYDNLIFCSSVIKKNIIGTQFHPEKSGEAGLTILKEIKNIL